MFYFFLSLFSCLSSSFPPPKKIDEENEANLLAVLTETLDSIPVDEDGLPSFEALADGDVTNASDQSCPSSPDGSPHTPEPEEPSLVTPSPFYLIHLAINESMKLSNRFFRRSTIFSLFFLSLFL